MYGSGLPLPALCHAVISAKMRLCDMIVHVGGKRTHGRYLLFRQRVEQFPGDKPASLEELGQQRIDQNQPPNSLMIENQQNHRISSGPELENDVDGDTKMDNELFDLNSKPQRIHGKNSTDQEQGVDVNCRSNYESASLLPNGSCKNEAEK